MAQPICIWPKDRGGKGNFIKEFFGSSRIAIKSSFLAPAILVAIRLLLLLANLRIVYVLASVGFEIRGIHPKDCPLRERFHVYAAFFGSAKLQYYYYCA